MPTNEAMKRNEHSDNDGGRTHGRDRGHERDRLPLEQDSAIPVHGSREHRRRRFRRHRRRAYIRSVHSLPSLATLGNVICGFAAIYVATLVRGQADPIAARLAAHPFSVAAYLIFLAMGFDALDGRLARYTRHTTDFGGQLDSLADVISFGVAPAFLALQVMKQELPVNLPFFLTRLFWAIAALYVSCGAMRLARFNVSNKHGEQHHFSFLGLPIPGAGGTVAAVVLLQQYLREHASTLLQAAADICVWVLPVIVLTTGLLMVSTIRYPHLVNRYMLGRRSLARVVGLLLIGLLFVVWHQYVLALGMVAYVLSGLSGWAFGRFRRSGKAPEAAAASAARSMGP
jgi:CDP-diacylglycerol--serine O-phosphatidyltransferase